MEGRVVKEEFGLDRPADGTVDRLYRRPAFMIRRVHQIVTALFEEVADGVMTQTQFATLYCLRQRPGIDQTMLSRLIGHDRSTTALVVEKLEKSGFVVRSPDPQDRRRNLLRVTPAGEEVLLHTLPFLHHTHTGLLSPLTTTEAAEFTRLLGKVVSAYNDRIRTPIPSEA
jgi:DNA-binding MarR family transcriptional regulator